MATKKGAQFRYICGPKKQIDPVTLDATYGKDSASTLLYDNTGYVFKCPDYDDDPEKKKSVTAATLNQALFMSSSAAFTLALL